MNGPKIDPAWIIRKEGLAPGALTLCGLSMVGAAGGWTAYKAWHVLGLLGAIIVWLALVVICERATDVSRVKRQPALTPTPSKALAPVVRDYITSLAARPSLTQDVIVEETPR